MRQAVQKIDLQSSAFKDHPEVTWKLLRAQGPVVTTRQPLLGRIALTTRHTESLIVLKDTDRFTVDARLAGHRHAAGMRWWVPGLLRPLADNMLTHDGEEHLRLRQRVDSAFRKLKLEQLQPLISAFSTQAIDKLAASANHEHDFVRSVARPVPQQVVSELLGVGEHNSSINSPLNRA